MKTKQSSIFSKLALTALVVSSAFATFPVASSAEAVEDTPTWSREDASNFTLTDENTAPNIDSFTDVAPEYWVWDTWPLRDRDGSIAKINGYYVQFALTASKDYTWGGRHDHAVIRYFYSKNGKDWELGTIPYDEDKALGFRQWAGSAMIDEDDKIHLFYTASGRKDEGPTFEQRLAKTTFEMDYDNKEGFQVTNNGEHQILAEADGVYYETQAQKTGDIIYSFRDPWFFQHPETGEEYLIFEGNTGGTDKTLEADNIGNVDGPIPDGAEDYNGNVGIAKAENDDLTEFELMPPLLEADGVNQQLERPHVVQKGDDYYLFTISHQFTFAPGLDGPDGLYGFHANELFGDYEPMNGTGLVVANPENDPFQAYSWAVLPHGQVISFINEFHDENGDFQLGGSFAPTLKLKLKDDTSEIKGVMGEGEIHG
ncbi:glycoside hydrolase family 68 protein [Halobacillus litoralis]|uniref:Glycoside hydrolase family 68 protein n=1 Tax=Halobacillus litoralis TaxID=45668 RepID=A0A845E211_9BACI|nr:glycoside hydrolase family 68 protein [Halobacillus litoralis]MYL48246.1 glycoside hydrolase family 68 protein [Halobacillus litoralis]